MVSSLRSGTMSFLTNKSLDLDGHPPPLRDDTPSIDPQEARPPQDPAKSVTRTRPFAAPERQCPLARCFLRQESVHGAGLPGGQVPR